MALKAGRVGVNPNYVDKEGRPLYDNAYLKELLRKEGIITLFTKEGNPISIDNAVAGRVYDLAVTMSPKQAGTGTPSPTNVREITGYTGLTITVNGTDIERDFDTTVYGGIDDVTGEGVTILKGSVDLGTLEWEEVITAVTGKKRFRALISNAATADISNPTSICSHYTLLATGGTWPATNTGYTITPYSELVLYDDNLATLSAEEFATAVSGVIVVYDLITSTSIPLTPQAVTLATGANTVSSDTGTTTDLKYLGTLVPGGANGRSLNRSLSLNREVIDGEARKEIQDEIKEVPVEEPVTVKKSTKKSTK